jgi:predicted amidohydrolase YtcJ
LRRGCVKIFVDGVLEGETAALLEPYAGPRPHRGTLHVDEAALATAVTRYDADGVQVHFHTIGDRAVRAALDAIEAARRANGPRDRRHHLAHLQLVDPAGVPRFAALDATATFQPLWAYRDSYVEANVAQVGAERVDRMYPIGAIHRAGGRIAGGSDWPVTSMNPLPAIEVALTRQDPAGAAAAPLGAGERVDLDTMIAAFTTAGAWLRRDEAATGTIEVGRTADLVVLERDLFAIPPSEIGEVTVELTVFDGRVVYRRAPAPSP